MHLTFQVETIDQCWDDIMVLARQHAESTTSYRRHEPFNPSYARYKACNETGFYRQFTARSGKRLAGYFGLYVTPSMHSQILMATEDTFYLLPDYRGGRNALRFLLHIINRLREWQVQEFLVSCETENETGIKGLLNMLDFKPVIMQYSLNLSPRADSSTTSMSEASSNVSNT